MNLTLSSGPLNRPRSTSAVRRQSLVVDLRSTGLDFVCGADPYDDLALPVEKISALGFESSALRPSFAGLSASLRERVNRQGRRWYDANDLRDELDTLLRVAIPGQRRRLFAAMVADLAATLGTRAFSEIDWNEVFVPTGRASKSELLALSALRIVQGRSREASGLLDLVRRRSGVWRPPSCSERFEQLCKFALADQAG